MKERLELLLKNDQLSRIEFGTDEMTVDLHKMGRAECCWLIRTIIASTMPAFRLNLIHGYNHGVTLKQAIQTEKLSQRVTDMYSDPWNPGLTHITVAGMLQQRVSG